MSTVVMSTLNPKHKINGIDDFKVQVKYILYA